MSVDVVKVLIQNGADVNAVQEDKCTALHLAAEKGHVDTAKVLIQNNVDMNAFDFDGLTALHFAIKKNNVAIVNMLLENDADINAATGYDMDTPLHFAAGYGNVDLIKVLLQNGADVNAVTGDGDSVLYTAAYYEHVRCTLQLLCFGADITMVKKYERTGLIKPIKKRFISLREGNGMETNLMTDEERRFMWNLAFFFTIKHREAAFKAYYAIRSFITYHGIFMGPGYDLGNDSIWRKGDPRDSDDSDW